MTHYRLTLTAGRAENLEIIAEVHKDTPRLERGWAKQLLAYVTWNAHIRRCKDEDAVCGDFQDWLMKKAEHEDDLEVEPVQP